MNLLVFAFGILHFSFGAEVCYPPCGCFSDDAPFDDRPLPETWESSGINLKWVLRTGGGPSVDIPMDESIEIPPAYDRSLQTKIMIHGWNSSPVTWDEVREAYEDTGNYNLILADWSEGADSVLYPESASNTRVVGACTLFMAGQLGLNLGQVQCIGHSLGAHTCGYLGKESGSQLGRITGLDPAGPLFENANAVVRLDLTDCEFMDIIHTSAGGNVDDLGLRLNVGDVDFYPNNGHHQPGCGNNPNCDHGICKDYMAMSIYDPLVFESNPCDSGEDAEAGLCDSCAGSECQYMGQDSINHNGDGTFYIDLGT